MNNNFKRNLLIGFSSSLIILLISSIASLMSISKLLESVGWVNHTNEVIMELEAVNAALVDAETGQRGFLLTGDEAFLKPYEDSKVRATRAYEKVLTLTKDNPLQQSDLPKLLEMVSSRFDHFNLTIDSKKNGGVVDTRILEGGRQVMDKIRDQIKVMEEREQNLLKERTSSMDQFSIYTPPLIAIGAFIAVLITVVFYFRVRNDFSERLRLQQELEKKEEEITTRIGIIRGISDKISQGNYSIRVDDKQSDALGSVAGSLNRMATSLEYSFDQLSNKEWQQTGLAKLNDLMIGDKEISNLSNQVIDFLASYSNSSVGALYILENGELTVSAGYAFIDDQSRRKIKSNEGLLGQSIVARKPIELKNVPVENVAISFATGAVKPRHVIAIPILDGHLVKGAFELASVNEFSSRDIEFLTLSAPNIGIAISTAQSRDRIQKLLEETQAQSEELRTQHTELENLNSELEVQAEKLQASEEELKVQQEELKQANQELEERSRLLEEKNQVITERNLDIQTKAEQLEQSTKYKSEFLANMSHELRTPLNSILLLSRLMGENQEKNLTPDQVEYAKVIQSSGGGLLSLIDEILDLSKIESGKMQLEYQTVSVEDIMKEMHSLFDPIVNEKKIEFRTSIGVGVNQNIETDKLRLDQILRNLLSNAIKFTAQGYVSLSIEKDQGQGLKFVVKDTGIGIPKEKQSLIFEAFQQADGSTRRKYGGTGLGLSISRELAKLLGGEITLKSEVEQGSEFVLYLPVSKGAISKKDAETIEVKSIERSVSERRPIVTERKYISTHIPENIPDDRKEIKEGDRVILIIEDDVNFAKSVLEYARKREYKGVVAVRGDEGIELAKQFLPIGILLDIQLPIKSGWEVMEELKGNSETRHIPVHIMSSYELKGESLMKGAVDFINKPVAFDQMPEIFKKIEYVLSHHPKKVLIVEENAKHAKALAYFLETFEVQLEIKNQVNDAISSLRETGIDCVILDMGIPDQKAYDTLEEVKKTPGLENIPIIIFTGKSLSQAEEMKIKQYADSIVVKTAHSYKRILDEVSLFLHLVEKRDNEPAAPKYHKLGALDEVLKGKSVLVADDDMRNIFSLTKALEKYQMNVIAAVDGKDALQKLNANPKIDIVLMDMMMPEMDGYESTAAIRKNPRFRNLPVIAVTAKAMMGDRAKCINAGASDYITKPVDIDQLLSLLRVWLYERGSK